ncbi:CYCD1.1 protein [Gonium pectorale]|uniref:CYCD1.1 protein n=1 Tax=Gonium pectorale TaxID=33097 RepID=A0A150G867_GONPE|nr:CYCD1.1 protein [Gonium pectorale]|eukprot:KXZ46024.1 CYCD1.1 protein [Gonium pectorale]
MIQAAALQGLQPGTLFAAVGLMDNFLAASEDAREPPETMLQLLALACLSLATKRDETRAPGLYEYRNAAWVCLAIDDDGRPAYQAKDLAKQELLVMKALRWRLDRPTVHSFLQHYLRCMAHRRRDGAAPPPPPPPPFGNGGSASPASASAGNAALGELDTAAPNPAPPTAADALVPSASDVAPQRVLSLPTAGLQAGASLLAEVSLLYENLLMYDASTVALACVALAAAAGAGAAAEARLAAAPPRIVVRAALGNPYKRLAIDAAASAAAHAAGNADAADAAAAASAAAQAAADSAANAAAVGAAARAAARQTVAEVVASLGLPQSEVAPGLSYCYQDLQQAYRHHERMFAGRR